MLSNFEIASICKYYNIDLNFIGMKEDLQHIPPKKGNYIININNEHWLCLVLDKQASFYFDSFAAPAAKDILNFVNRYKPNHFGYNQFIIQDMESSYCGFFCVGLLWWIKQKQKKFKSLHNCVYEYINKFVDDTKKNDQILRNIFKELTNNKAMLKILISKLKLNP